MKILEINKFNYLRRGAEKHYLDVIALLKSHSHQVAVFSMKHPNNIPSVWEKYFVSNVGFGEKDSVFSKLKGLFRIYSFEAKIKIRKLLDDFKPDVVHIHNIYHHISPSILSEIKKRDIPIIMTVHDYNLVCPDYSLLCNGKKWNELNRNRSWYFLKNKCFKKSYIQSLLVLLEFKFNKLFGFYEKYVDKFIAPSGFVKNILIGEGIDPEKIEIISHFISQDFINNKLDTDKNIAERYAFYYGSISKEKNVDALIDIFKDEKNIKLYLAGNIEENFVLPKQENIKYLGFLSSQEIKNYINQALFTISLSKLPETFGLVALESIALGKPFIALDAGAYKEIIEQGKTGFICKDLTEVKEKISQIVSGKIVFDEKKIAQIAQEKFGQEKYYQKFMKN
ncbi:MAG: hypothetical protein A2271_04230 [Candidatus Moranbacteria bacterium RIFOXYA12_FULL_35_19]|nr:MAG: hypothetical protein UR78_C0014G0036 [Candidatus Moranbacteria bacterium GW2011_GWF2_35_39]OGI36889.1 MAG: hypothetical protein A2271_04230 [Candidatus Moranbacteria bacterium RIFOXYA12_FULL_35_19]